MSNSISGNAGGIWPATVWLSGRTINGAIGMGCVVDSSGNYTFGGLPAGTYTVRAGSVNYNFSGATVSISLANPQDQTDVNLTATKVR